MASALHPGYISTIHERIRNRRHDFALRFTLAIYQRPLQRLVDRTLAGSTVTFPQRIGPFVIYKTSREDPGIASLWHRLKGPFFFGVLLAKPGTTIFSGSFMVLQPYRSE